MLKNEEILGSEDFCNAGNTIFDAFGDILIA